MCEDLFRTCLANASKYADHVVFGFFGEQMLHPQFAEFMAMIPAKRRYRVILFTNWSLATSANMRALMHVDNLRISIDASTSDVFETVRPGGPVLDLDGEYTQERFTALMDKLDYWLRLPGHPRTTLKYTVSSLNEHDRDAFVKKFRQRLPPSDSIVTKSVISYGGVMRDRLMESHPCQVPNQQRLTVAWNGDCSPCNLDTNISLKVGNLAETEDLRHILRSEQYQKTLEAMRSRRGSCANCFDANNHTKRLEYFGTGEVQ